MRSEGLLEKRKRKRKKKKKKGRNRTALVFVEMTRHGGRTQWALSLSLGTLGSFHSRAPFTTFLLLFNFLSRTLSLHVLYVLYVRSTVCTLLLLITYFSLLYVVRGPEDGAHRPKLCKRGDRYVPEGRWKSSRSPKYLLLAVQTGILVGWIVRRYFLHFDSDAKGKLGLSDISRIWVDQLRCLTLYGALWSIMEYYGVYSGLTQKCVLIHLKRMLYSVQSTE